MRKFDVIVVGAGHAGCEAALAPARMGLSVLMITLDRTGVARMSCNPAIGGLAKGQLVREIDALGGEMGLAIDAAGTHFRILNRSRGPAVRAPRAQADREAYSAYMARVVDRQQNLLLEEGEVADIVTDRGAVAGVTTSSGERIAASAVIVTAGTFLDACMYVGDRRVSGGRRGEPAAERLARSMSALGFRTARMKTGTPPRLSGETIDRGRTGEQKPDDPPRPFSFRTVSIDRPQVSCLVTRTTGETHEVIRSFLDRSPLFTGKIKGAGPRYCPSIEDKVVRFAHHHSHQIFLEEEGGDGGLVYPNGISTSLPEEAQRALVKTIPGLEEAEIVFPGYAVEYDFFPTDQIRRSLETKLVERLYFAGQVNGTSGYEEAAAQGLIAGVNAARRIGEEEPVILGRSEAYIGVLIDDLITCEPEEPYRMFTSRAEHRLLLRHDTADIRLAPLGVKLGLLPEEVLRRAREREAAADREVAFLEKTVAGTADARRIVAACGGEPPAGPARLAALLRRPEIGHEKILPFRNGEPAPPEPVREEAEFRIKYEGYVRRQERALKRVASMEHRAIPGRFDYGSIGGISAEGREKLGLVQPETVGVASRIDGVTPADISLLVVHLDRRSRERGKKR